MQCHIDMINSYPVITLPDFLSGTQSVRPINFFWDLNFLPMWETSLWEPNRLFINERKLYQEQTSLINTSPALPVFDLPI